MTTALQTTIDQAWEGRASLGPTTADPSIREAVDHAIGELNDAMRNAGMEAGITEIRMPKEDLLVEITEAMTTNETSFFRDTKPFQLFQETILPHMIENRGAKRTLRIWCAACSSGQEPYSLSMILMAPALASW